MKERNNIFSVFCIQGGETGQQAALMLARTFSEKIKKRTGYIPAGVVFDDTGNVSLTELYFDFTRNRELRIDRNEQLTIIKPFNCFAEFIEIANSTYFEFIDSISSEFDISVINMENLSAEMVLYFIEKSMTTAIVIDCGQNSYASRFESFIRNLKLLRGNCLADYLDKFIFIINKGSENDKLFLNDIALRESECDDFDFINKMYFLENNLLSQKNIINKKSDISIFNIVKNISKKAEVLFNAK